MYYIKKKIEKKELINNNNNNLYLQIFNKKLIFNYKNISLLFYYTFNNNISHIKQYLKEVGIIK